MLDDECALRGCNGSDCSGCPACDPREEQTSMEEIDKMFMWWEAQHAR